MNGNMICFVTTRSHQYTHKRLRKWSEAPQVEIWSYDRLLTARSLPVATWIFCDLDRLGFWELELAAHVWRILRDAGLRVLNDPARVRQRYPLLRLLKRNGLSCFDAWHPDSDEWPVEDAFPVFLRTMSAHRGVIGDLIADHKELERQVEAAVGAGFPRRDLIVVQYAAEPIEKDLFRKLAIFRIGEHMVPALCVHQQHWCVQNGTVGIATAELYAEEHDFIVSNPHGERLMPAFSAAEIDYGRADFAFPHGELAIYEINTNPAIGSQDVHPSPVRLDSHKQWRKKYAAALAEIDTPAGGARIKLSGEILQRQRRRDFPIVRSRWTA